MTEDAYTRAMRAPLDRSPTLDDSNFVQYAEEQTDAWAWLDSMFYGAKWVGAFLALIFVLALSYVKWPVMVAVLSFGWLT